MLVMPPDTLLAMREKREELHERVHAFALRQGLPDDPEGFFVMDPSMRNGKGIFESSTDGEDDGETRTPTGLTWFSGPRDRSQMGRVRGQWDAVRRLVRLSFGLVYSHREILAEQVLLDRSSTKTGLE